MASPNGRYVRGYLASSDITTAVDVPLFDRDGIAYVLQVGERLVLDFLSLNNGATASIITLFADKNGGGTLDAGEELYSASVAVNAQNFMDDAEIVLPRLTAAGGKLKVVASVASVGSRIIVVGRVVNT